MSNRPAALGPIESRPINSITPYSGNPRRIPPIAVETTAKSIKEFGWQQPLVVNREGVLLAGHTRLEAAKHLGLSEVPVVVADLEGDRAAAFRIADNRTADLTEWDFPALIDELEVLGTEFDEVLLLEDWQGIIATFEAGYMTDGDEVPPPPTPQESASLGPQAGERAPTGGTAPAPAPAARQADEGGGIPMDEEAAARINGGRELTVVCRDDQVAARVSLELIEMDGVLDVRHKRV